MNQICTSVSTKRYMRYRGQWTYKHQVAQAVTGGSLAAAESLLLHFNVFALITRNMQFCKCLGINLSRAQVASARIVRASICLLFTNTHSATATKAQGKCALRVLGFPDESDSVTY